MNRHAEYPFSSEIKRRIFQDRRAARVQAAWEFLGALVLSTILVGVLTLAIALLTE